MTDYYQMLGVSRTATSAEVRKAYARLARERHPDHFSDPGEKERAESDLKQITAAFNALSNERERKEYDASLDHPSPSTPEEMAQQAFAHGVRLLERGHYDEAAPHFRAAAHQAPNEARYRAALGRALSKNPHSAREAIEALEHAVRLAPQRASFHAELAALLLAQGLGIRARKAAETALRLNPGDPEIRRIAREVGIDDREPPPQEGGLRGLLRRKP